VPRGDDRDRNDREDREREGTGARDPGANDPRPPYEQQPTEAWSVEDFWAARDDDADADPFWAELAEEKESASGFDPEQTTAWSPPPGARAPAEEPEDPRAPSAANEPGAADELGARAADDVGERAEEPDWSVIDPTAPLQDPTVTLPRAPESSAESSAESAASPADVEADASSVGVDPTIALPRAPGADPTGRLPQASDFPPGAADAPQFADAVPQATESAAHAGAPSDEDIPSWATGDESGKAFPAAGGAGVAAAAAETVAGSLPPAAATPDAGTRETAAPDVNTPDAARTDAARADAARADAARADAARADAAREPVVARRTMHFQPTSLSRRRAATLAAFCDALIPSGGAMPYAAADVGVAERVDASLASWDPGARRAFRRALGALEWSALFSRHLRPFSKLGAAAQLDYVERAAASTTLPRRAPVDLLKFYCLNQWASTPPVEQALGFTYECVTADPPRDGDRLEVLSYPQIARDHVEECDAVVIGSGAGGAVVAKELAEIGLSVVVVEEGGYFTRRDFTGPPFERFLKMYRRQGMTGAVGSPPVAMPLGAAVGGTTLVSSGSSFRTPDRVLRAWESEFALPGTDPDSMKKYFDRVERVQRVQPVPEHLLGENARRFRAGAQALGVRGEPMRRMIEGCRGCGVCDFGCPSDAKLGTNLTYLPRAQRAGTTIYGHTRAERILVEDGRARGIECSLLDPKTREPRARLFVRAKVVIVAAGAVHTPALLARNALGNRSGQLGRNLRVHPSVNVGALFDEPVYAWRGTLQPFYVDEWHESHDVMVEVTASVPSVGAGTFPGAGASVKELLGKYPHLGNAAVFVSDTSSGHVIARGAGEPTVTYKLNSTDARKIVRGIAHAANVWFAAGARAVVTNIAGAAPIESAAQLAELEEDAIKPGALRLSGLHPVGTARMGVDPARSVTDPWGEVHGITGLYLADASVLPGCPTVNPQTTIMAFATRTVEHLAREGARYFD
jgi:choline dehydrogenase-like flavoprotein